MALGTPTLARKIKTAPIFIDQLTFAGDGTYPAGGTAAFTTFFKTALEAADMHSAGREILSIVQVDASGYVLRYDKANDKLMAFESDNGGADGPLQESTTANMSGVTFRVMITSI
jgi:hypothetical protein